MKLLTLEEIEEIQNDTDKIGETYINVSEMMVGIKTMQSLLATARAYWELMDKLKKNIPMLRQWLNEDRKAKPLVHSHDIAQWLEVPMEFKGYMSNADEQKIIDAVKTADKPHLPTLKVIMEAMNEVAGTNTQWTFEGNPYEETTTASAIAKSLEKHLE